MSYVQRGHLVGEVADGHRRRAVIAQVGHVDAHARAGVAVAVVGQAERDADFFERAVAAVAEHEVADGVVGDDQVDAGVAVERDQSHPERFGGRLLGGRFGHDETGRRRALGKAAAAQVHVEGRRRAGEVARGAVGAPDAGQAEVLGQVEGASPAHVAAHEQVEIAVVVGVEPGGARAPVVGAAGHAGAGGDVVKTAADVLEQGVPPDGGDVEVGPAVVVEVAGGHAHAVALHRQAQGGRGLGEVSSAIVGEDHERGGRAAGPCRGGGSCPRPGAPVHEHEVEVAVIVQVDQGAAAAGGFGQQLLAVGAVDACDASQARVARDIDEVRWGRHAAGPLAGGRSGAERPVAGDQPACTAKPATSRTTARPARRRIVVRAASVTGGLRRRDEERWRRRPGRSPRGCRPGAAGRRSPPIGPHDSRPGARRDGWP